MTVAGRGWLMMGWVNGSGHTLTGELLATWCGSVARVCGRADVRLPHPLAALRAFVPVTCPLPTAARVLSAASDPAMTRSLSMVCPPWLHPACRQTLPLVARPRRLLCFVFVLLTRVVPPC